jgi:glycosyltransferase involved in cell wall biosynthesis
MTDGPLVSIIIPTFNRTQYLRTALGSALAQTYRHIEVLIADDASSADVRGSIADLLPDPRVTYHRNPTNLGMGGNTWTALMRASGTYVATIHDDDAWEPDFLATLVPPLEADGTLSVAFSDHHVMDENGVLNEAAASKNSRQWRRDRLARGVVRPFAEVAILWQAVPAAMAALFRKSAIDWADFPPEVGTYYDIWLAYLASRSGAGAYYEPRRLTRYRVHAQSETLSWGSPSGRVKALRQSEFVGRRYVADPGLRDLRAELQRRYVKAVRALGLALMEQGRADEARTTLSAARALTGDGTLAVMGLCTHLPSTVQQRLGPTVRRLRALVKRP